MSRFKYVIVGMGLAGASALQGVRQLDPHGDVLIIGNEKYLPYHRPPLTKSLWRGKSVEDIFVRRSNFYECHGARTMAEINVASVDPSAKSITTDKGENIGFDSLLLATGGIPHIPDIEGESISEIIYFRTLDDYEVLRRETEKKRRVLIVGGGFIGTELGASLNRIGVDVSIIFPHSHLLEALLPEPLGLFLNVMYMKKGVRLYNRDRPVSFRRKDSSFTVRTDRGQEIECDLVVVGAGIRPAVNLAVDAGLRVDDGILLDEYLQTSAPYIYAAGDNSSVPSPFFGRVRRFDHWDNAVHQGLQAGRNMAGAREPYRYLPCLFSSFFDIHCEAVGEVGPSLRVVYDWKEKYRQGVVYYLKGQCLRGVLLWNLAGRVGAARRILELGGKVRDEDLLGVLR